MMAVVPIFLSVILAAGAPSGEVPGDSEIWNRGVDAYRAACALAPGSSNYTAAVEQALAVLRPLMLSRTHGARASELVGALCQARRAAAGAADPAAAAAAADEAAAAFQLAWRAAPDDARARRNFTRAADRVDELRTAAHVQAALAAAQNTPPDRQLGEAVRTARDVLAAAQGVLTNEAPQALAQSEALARRASALADVWIPLKEHLARAAAQNATNQQQLAWAVNEVEAAQMAARTAATQLADLDPSAQTALAQTEDVLTRFWKGVILPPDAARESYLAQTNAFCDAPAVNNRPWPREALAFTQAFRARFPAWAQQYEQQAQADTNKPPFTKEAQAEINSLAGEVEKIQLANVKAEDPPSMLEALAKLARIRELLPKDPQGGGGAGTPPPEGQKPPEDQKPPEAQNKPEDQKSPENPPPPEEQKQADQPEKSEKPAPPPKDEELDALLQKAQERQEQHENEKKARLRKAPLSPNERDW